jgi:hypothetical protein
MSHLMKGAGGGVATVGAICLLVLANSGLAAEPAATTSPSTAVQKSYSGEALRAAVRDALRRQVTARDEAAIREMISLYGQVQTDTSLARSQRESLRLSLRGKLLRLGTALEHRVAVADKVRLPAQPAILAQQVPAMPGAQPQRPPVPADHSQELLELIQDTIAPASWEVRGGGGTIRYWSLGHAMVVRQTGEVHESLGHLLIDLR